MFYCDDCGRSNEWPIAPIGAFRSHGPCEICHAVADCNEVPSKDLPPIKRCPICGGTNNDHQRIQEIANQVRATLGLPPLDPPDIDTGYQKR